MNGKLTPTSMPERILDLKNDEEIEFFRRDSEATTQTTAEFSPENFIERILKGQQISYLEIEALTKPERKLFFQRIEEKLDILKKLMHITFITLTSAKKTLYESLETDDERNFFKKDPEATAQNAAEFSPETDEFKIIEKEYKTPCNQYLTLEHFGYTLQDFLERYDYEHDPNPNKPVRYFKLCLS
ncbi:MAG: hypothetical protein WC806_00240 [Candidatus Gracilibacteria bacterium]|jgi:hypothetical protein